MANTYTLIQAQTLASSAATVTFSSIPATYTDLVLRVSARTDRANPTDACNIRFNGDTTATTYSRIYLLGNGAATGSAATANETSWYDLYLDAATATANTFGSMEVYIPSYTASQSKPASVFIVQEDNNATAYITALSHLYRNTAAITSMVIYPQVGLNWVTGSSFYLYGIKNS